MRDGRSGGQGDEPGGGPEDGPEDGRGDGAGEASPMEDTEIEAKLAIRSADPARVMEVVARLEVVAGFRLLPLPTVRIRDRYLELPGAGQTAGGSRLALRRREVDGRSLLTLKGEAEGGADRAASGVTRRLEIEVPEDEAGWGRIREALGEAGVRVGNGLAWLNELRPFQVRETLRLRRAVMRRRDGEGAEGRAGEGAKGRAGDPPAERTLAELTLAELTLDTVTLDVLGRRVRFREVEVEARADAQDPARLVAEIGTALRNVVGCDWLQPWSLSKLATGAALERLAEAGELDRLVGGTGDLLPEGLDRLEGFRG